MQRNGTLFITLVCPLAKDLLCHGEIVIVNDTQGFDPFRCSISVFEKTAVDTVLQNPQDVIALEICTTVCTKSFSMLSSVQQRRIQMYYFADMTYEEIAEAEQCSFQAVEKTLRKARKTIMNIFKMFP